MPFEAGRSTKVSSRIRSSTQRTLTTQSSSPAVERVLHSEGGWYPDILVYAIGQSNKKCMKYVYCYVLAFMLH